MGAERMEILNARVTDEMRADLKAEAERRGVSISDAVREAIAAWVKSKPQP